MTDDRNATHGDLSSYGHKTLARCLHRHEPIGRYLDEIRGFAADLKAKGIIGDSEPEPGTAPWFERVREELAAEGHRIDAGDWLWTEGEQPDPLAERRAELLTDGHAPETVDWLLDGDIGVGKIL